MTDSQSIDKLDKVLKDYLESITITDANGYKIGFTVKYENVDRTKQAIINLIEAEVLKGKIEEVEWIRSRYTAFTWGHYDPFGIIDSRLKELEEGK